MVSFAGNDALDHPDILMGAHARPVADVLGRLAAIAEGFERAYHQKVKEGM
jgi:hypothetical protein